jgi:hypothetical protein
MRALEEGAAVAKRLADTTQGALRERFLEKEGTLKNQARTIQEILLSRSTSSAMDVVGGAWEAVGG